MLVDTDALPEKDYNIEIEQSYLKPKTEQVVNGVQQSYEKVLGDGIELVELNIDEASKIMNTSNSNLNIIENENTPTYKVLKNYDEVCLLIENTESGADFLAEHIKKINELQAENPLEQKTKLNVKLFKKDQLDLNDEFSYGELKNKLTDNPYILEQIEHKLKEYNYMGPFEGYPRSYILENLNKTLDETEFSDSGKKLIRVYLGKGLNTLNEELFKEINKKSKEKNIKIEFIDFDFDGKYDDNFDMVYNNCMRIFSLEDLITFFEKNKEIEGLKLQENIDYYDKEKLDFFNSSDKYLDNENLEKLSGEPINLIIEKNDPFIIPNKYK